MKLNIGSHAKKLDGFLNLDILAMPGVDIVQDATEPPYHDDAGELIVDGMVEEIVSQEFLEHIGFRNLHRVLQEWVRILAPNGSLTVQVPNIDSMCRMIDLQCECVPRKAEKMEDFKADSSCEICEGKALIHPERWRYAFTGAQKHPYDAHLNIFTPQSMYDALDAAGFVDIVDRSNPYKIVMHARKAS